MFFIIEMSEDATFEFIQNAAVVWFWLCKKMETQKVVNLLGEADNESPKSVTRKWYVINDQNMVKEIKVVQPLNLKPKLLNQVYVIIQMHIFL